MTELEVVFIPGYDKLYSYLYTEYGTVLFFCYGVGMPPLIYSLLKLYDYSIKGLLGGIKLWSCLVSCPSDKKSLPSLTTQLRVRSATP